jgi:hypothetical protein
MNEQYIPLLDDAPAEPTPAELWEYEHLDELLAEAATHPERDDG